MSRTKIVRQNIWSKLTEVARPDSRFHFDFAEFIPDFVGSDSATDRMFALPVMTNAKLAFVTPDNSLIDTRRRLIEKALPFVVATHNINRGFRLVDPAAIPAGQAHFAAHLEGLELFGKPVSLEDISTLGAFDVMITGASAISADGVRFGKGHIYFDLEWGMFSEIGLVSDATPVLCLVHDVQLVNDKLFALPEDLIVDCIMTPTRRLEILRRAPRPRGIKWESVDPDQIEAIPPLQELQRVLGLVR